MTTLQVEKGCYLMLSIKIAVSNASKGRKIIFKFTTAIFATGKIDQMSVTKAYMDHVINALAKPIDLVDKESR